MVYVARKPAVSFQYVTSTLYTDYPPAHWAKK
jgi:hypothetical protein